MHIPSDRSVVHRGVDLLVRLTVRLSDSSVSLFVGVAGRTGLVNQPRAELQGTGYLDSGTSMNRALRTTEDRKPLYMAIKKRIHACESSNHKRPYAHKNVWTESLCMRKEYVLIIGFKTCPVVSRNSYLNVVLGLFF